MTTLASSSGVTVLVNSSHSSHFCHTRRLTLDESSTSDYCSIAGFSSRSSDEVSLTGRAAFRKSERKSQSIGGGYVTVLKIGGTLGESTGKERKPFRSMSSNRIIENKKTSSGNGVCVQIKHRSASQSVLDQRSTQRSVPPNTRSKNTQTLLSQKNIRVQGKSSSVDNYIHSSVDFSRSTTNLENNNTTATGNKTFIKDSSSNNASSSSSNTFCRRKQSPVIKKSTSATATTSSGSPSEELPSRLEQQQQHRQLGSRTTLHSKAYLKRSASASCDIGRPSTKPRRPFNARFNSELSIKNPAVLHSPGNGSRSSPTFVEENLIIFRLPGEKLGLGLRFEGGSQPEENVKRLFIQCCAKNSPARRTKCAWGSLEEGDEIINIGGKLIKRMTRSECVKALKESPVSVNMRIRHYFNQFIYNSGSYNVEKTGNNASATTKNRSLSNQNSDPEKCNTLPSKLPSKPKRSLPDPSSLFRSANTKSSLSKKPPRAKAPSNAQFSSRSASVPALGPPKGFGDTEKPASLSSRHSVQALSLSEVKEPRCVVEDEEIESMVDEEDPLEVSTLPKSYRWKEAQKGAPQDEEGVKILPVLHVQDTLSTDSFSLPPQAEIYVNLLEKEDEIEHLRRLEESDTTGTPSTINSSTRSSFSSADNKSRLISSRHQFDLAKVLDPFEKLERELTDHVLDDIRPPAAFDESNSTRVPKNVHSQSAFNEESKKENFQPSKKEPSSQVSQVQKGEAISPKEIVTTGGSHQSSVLQGGMEDCLVSCHHQSFSPPPIDSTGPPSDSRLPPDGHEFPPDYKDPGTKDDLSPRKSSSSSSTDQFRPLKLLNSNRLITRHDEKSIKSVKAKIAMFQSPQANVVGKKEESSNTALLRPDSKTRSMTNVSSSNAKRTPVGSEEEETSASKFQNRSQSLLEIPFSANSSNNPSLVRRFNSSGYIPIDTFEHRRRSNISKLKGLVIPEGGNNAAESDKSLELPEIISKDLSEAKKISLTSSPLQTPPAAAAAKVSPPQRCSMKAPPWKTSSPLGGHHSQYSPAFKRKPFSLYEDSSPGPSDPPKARSTPLKDDSDECDLFEETDENSLPSRRVEAINRKNILDSSSCKKSSSPKRSSSFTIAERKKSFENAATSKSDRRFSREIDASTRSSSSATPTSSRRSSKSSDVTLEGNPRLSPSDDQHLGEGELWAKDDVEDDLLCDEDDSMDTIDDSSIKLGEEACTNVNVLYSSASSSKKESSFSCISNSSSNSTSQQISSSSSIKYHLPNNDRRKFSVPAYSSKDVKMREKKSNDPLPSRPSSLVEAAEMKVFEVGNLGPSNNKNSSLQNNNHKNINSASTSNNGATSSSNSNNGGRRAVSVNDIRRAFEKAEASLCLNNSNNNNSSSGNCSVGGGAPSHNRMSSIDSTTSDESSIPTPHLYGSVSSLISGQSNLKDHYGSITSLASSTSLISPQELQGLIDEANQSLEESGTPSHEIMVIVLHREFTAGSIGITLAGGVDYENKDITVHKVIPGTLADRDGRIQKGDRVLSINGRSTKGVTHREALSILKAPRAEVVLVLSRSRSVTPAEYDRNDFSSSYGRPPKILESPLDHKSLLSDLKFVDVPRSPPTTVVLKKEGTGLGFSLEGGKDSPVGDRPLTIKKIFTGGAADKSAILKVGDEILSVNNTDCTRMSRIEAWNFMKKLSDGMASIVVRQKLDGAPPSDLPEKSNPNILPGSHAASEESHSNNKVEANR